MSLLPSVHISLRFPQSSYRVRRFFRNMLRCILECLVIIGLAVILAAGWYVIMFVY